MSSSSREDFFEFDIDTFRVKLAKLIGDTQVDMNNPYHLYQITRDLLFLRSKIFIKSINILGNSEIKLGDLILFSPIYKVNVFLKNEELLCEENLLLSLLCAEKFIKKYGEKFQELFKTEKAIEPVKRNRKILKTLIIGGANETDKEYQRATSKLKKSLETYKRTQQSIEEYQAASAVLQTKIMHQATLVESLRSKILTENLIKKRIDEKKTKKMTSSTLFPPLKSFWNKEKEEEPSQKSQPETKRPPITSITRKKLQ